MTQRSDMTKWLWCLFAVYVGPEWGRAVSVKAPPKNPTTIEAQAKFFQYRHFPTHEDYDQGHRQGSERHFTERHERARPSDGLYSAKVRWGDKQGGYGEHYWDLNHAGHAGNHGNDEYDSSSDDGSYNHDLDHAHEENDAYDEPSDQLPTYGTEEYDPEQAAKYDESGRAKRAHPRIKTDRKLVREEEETYEEPQKPEKTHRHKDEEPQKQQKTYGHKHEESQKQQKSYGHKDEEPQKQQRSYGHKEEESQKQQRYGLKERLQAAPNKQEDNTKEVEENYEPQPQRRRRRQRKPENVKEETVEKPTEEVNQKVEQNQEQRPQYYVNRAEKHFVPYEQGAGVRQHHPPEATAAASAPRLFLEPTTGHVVDRATGQAYVLQPIAINNYN